MNHNLKFQIRISPLLKNDLADLQMIMREIYMKLHVFEKLWFRQINET